MNRTPLIIAVVLLLLPVMYVACYLALVVPDDLVRTDSVVRNTQTEFRTEVTYGHYRCGSTASEKLFWPLEQIDRKLRPEAWERDLMHFR